MQARPPIPRPKCVDPFELDATPTNETKYDATHDGSFRSMPAVLGPAGGECESVGCERAESQPSPRSRSIPPAPRRSFYLRQGRTSSGEDADENPQGAPFVPRGIETERVELQIEGLSTFVGRGMLIMWYAVVIAAVVVESLDFVSWGLMNICGEEVDDLRNYEGWQSKCVTELRRSSSDGLYTVRWTGGPYSTDIEDKLVRFPNIVLSLASPNDWDTHKEEERTYDLSALVPNSLSGEGSTTLLFSVTCQRSLPRCEFTGLPPSAVLKNIENGTKVLTITNLPSSLAQNIRKSSIGILFMRRNYSLGIVIWRYVLLFLSLMHLARFLVYNRFTSTIYEQSWVMALQLFLIWYLNPFLALSIWSKRPALIFDVLEFNMPTWFAAVSVGFMLSAITASMPWTPVSREERPVYNLLTLSGIKGFLRFSNSIYDPPLWTKCVVVLFILIIIALDFSGLVLYYLRTPRVWSSMTSWYLFMVITIGVLLVSGCSVCVGLLIHLHRNMGLKSYLDSRPQHLAGRVFIFVFVIAIAYYLFHVIIFVTHYATIPGMLARQPLMQLPSYMVASFFVNIMTLIYTRRNRDHWVPIHPRDERWKYMVWPDTWYRWLLRHGGSMYIFHNEAEEASFNWNQYEFRMRQHKAKLKRRKLRRGWFLRQDAGGAEAERRAGQDSVCPNTGNTTYLDVTNTADAAPTTPTGRMHPTSVLKNDESVINMDKTSSWFLPLQPRVSSVNSEQRFASGRANSFGGVPSMCQRTFRRFSTDVPRDGDALSRSTQKWNGPQVSFRLQGLFSSNKPPGPPCDNSVVPASGRHERETSLDFSRVGENVEAQEDVVTRTLARARERLGFILKTAERTFISRPIQAFTHLETAILDATMRRFQDVEYLPFFNLETAIDCFNLSWEAYGSPQETEVEFGNTRPFSLLQSCCFCCHCPSSPHNGSTEELPCELGVGLNVGPGERERNKESSEEKRDAAPPINVAQYGYSLCGVLEAMDVQIILCTLDLEKAKREGRAPRVVIAFRGTNSISNAWQDLRVHRVKWDEMEENETAIEGMCCGWQPSVHTGFLSIWKALRDRVRDKLWSVLSADRSTVYRVLCTGHSLGGALASLCAYSVYKMLNEKKYPLAEVTVYSFGQPPLGNKAFQKAYNKAVPRTFRVVNESDVVSLIRVYGCHVGVEVNIDRYGNYICKPTYMERLFRPTKGRGLSVENHCMERYGASLNAIARNTSCRITAYVGKEPDRDCEGNDAMYHEIEEQMV